MRFPITLAFLLLLVLLHPPAPILASSDASRLSSLTALKSATSSLVLPLTFDAFETYIESSPRSYSVFVMFSADPKMCEPCVAVHRQLSNLAKEYEALPANRRSSKPLFFAIIKISPSDKIFLTKYAVRMVPLLYLFRPGVSFPKALADNSPDNYPLQSVGMGLNQFREFINARAGARMKVVKGGYQIPFVQTVKAFMPVIVAVVAVSALAVVRTGAYKSPMLWFGLVVLVYIFSVGGGHYSWIHNTPLAVVNKEGMWEYVAGGSRTQYVAEGFFVSATCVSISVLVILIQELPSVIPNKSLQTMVGLSMVLMIAMAIVALLFLYHVKMPQYLQYTEMS